MTPGLLLIGLLFIALLAAAGHALYRAGYRNGWSAGLAAAGRLGYPTEPSP